MTTQEQAVHLYKNENWSRTKICFELRIGHRKLNRLLGDELINYNHHRHRRPTTQLMASYQMEIPAGLVQMVPNIRYAPRFNQSVLVKMFESNEPQDAIVQSFKEAISPCREEDFLEQTNYNKQHLKEA